MDIKDVNRIFVDLVTMYTNSISECDIYEVPDKNKAYMYIGTMIGLKEFRDAAGHELDKPIHELIPVTDKEE